MFLYALIVTMFCHSLFGSTFEEDENHEPVLHHSVVQINTREEITPRAEGSSAESVNSNHLPLNLAPLHPSQMGQSSILQQSLLPAKTPLNTKRLSESIIQNPGIVNARQSILIQQDPEASGIHEMARTVPVDSIKHFKAKFVSFADMLALTNKILAGFCASALGISGGDYVTNSGFIDESTRLKLAALSAIGVAVFSKIESLLTTIKMRDELRLMSYDKTEKFKQQKEAILGEGIYYTNEEIMTYLTKNNKFITLPSKGSARSRYFLFNAMCFFESFLAMLSSFSGGMSSACLASGLSGQNFLALSSAKSYRDLTIILGATTAILYGLDQKRAVLKEYCENWIQNYKMLCLYFILIEKVEKKDLYKIVRYAKADFIEGLVDNHSVNVSMQQNPA